MQQLDEGGRAWLLRTARDNYWRVAGWYEFDDLVQDGFVCWCRVVAKYQERDYISPSGCITKKPRRELKTKHLMGLFKRIYSNHINDLANKRTLAEAELLAMDLQQQDPDADSIWDEITKGLVDLDHTRLVAEAPATIKRLLIAILSDDGRPSPLQAAYRVLRTHRETTNERLCKLIGANPQDVELSKALRAYLKP